MPLNSVANSVAKNTRSYMPTMPTLPAVSPGWIRISIFLVLLIVFATLMIVYRTQVEEVWKSATESINGYFNPPAPAPAPVTEPTPEPAGPPTEEDGVMAKLLPSGGQEVFSIAANRFTYGDAEPLCKALGAELATYEQVKEAWGKGADWCNYGWVKGQMAVYPTQKETWDKVQAGPEEQRASCGNPGMNGGFFDNPDMRFGVTCYGQKPAQSKHDEQIASKGAPRSPGVLDFDKKVSKFRSEADHIGLLPFNTGKWQSS